MACFIGNALGDSLGANTEFMDLDYERIIFKTSFDDLLDLNRCKKG